MGRPVRPCLHCGRLSPATYCPACQSARWAEQGRRRPARPWYGQGWAKLSKQARTDQPWCSNCGATGPLQADHIRPRSLADGVRVLCIPCHGRLGGKTPSRQRR